MGVYQHPDCRATMCVREGLVVVRTEEDFFLWAAVARSGYSCLWRDDLVAHLPSARRAEIENPLDDMLRFVVWLMDLAQPLSPHVSLEITSRENPSSRS